MWLLSKRRVHEKPLATHDLPMDGIHPSILPFLGGLVEEEQEQTLPI